MKITKPKIVRKIQELVLFVTLILMLFVSGCASSSGGSSSPGGSGGSRTLKQVDMDVSPRMTQFHNATATGKFTQGEQDQINSAYARYQAAYREALQAAGNNPNAQAPDNVKTLATQVIGALEAAQ